MKPCEFNFIKWKCIAIFICCLIISKIGWTGVIATPTERSIVEKNISSTSASPITNVKSSTEEAATQNDVEHAALSAVKEETSSDQVENDGAISDKSNTTATTQSSPTNTTEKATLDVKEESKNGTSEKPEEQDFLPEEGAAEKEHSSSLAIFFVLFVIILCVFFVHGILKYNCHHIPESLAIVFLGALVGLFMKILPSEDIKQVESFSPTMFFLVLLPPIIFESGYNLHKGK